MPARNIRSLYIVGNSYSAATQSTGNKVWGGKLGNMLGFQYVQPNNVAVPGAQLLDIPARGKPGLLTQLSRIPAGPKSYALLTIWLFPDLTVPAPPSTWPLYTQGVDIAYSLGFRKIFMPNLPDITKTRYYKSIYTRMQLTNLHNMFANFNSMYATMIGSFRSRHPDTAFASCDMFNLWDGQTTGPDNFHPSEAGHALFAGWFFTAVHNL